VSYEYGLLLLTTPDQEEINGCSLLELPATSQYFLKSEKVAMGILNRMYFEQK
jgi:hypothetical protein